MYPRQPSGPSHGPCSSRPHLGRGAHEPLRLVGEGPLRLVGEGPLRLGGEGPLRLVGEGHMSH